MSTIAFMNITNTTTFINYAQLYAYSLPNLILQGDFAAITIGSIIFLVVLFLVNKITSLLLALIKKTIFLFITGLAVYYLTTEFYTRLLTTGPTVQIILLGVFGATVGIFGVILSFKTWFTGAKKGIQEIRYGTDLNEKSGLGENFEKDAVVKEINELKNIFSIQAIKQDKNLLSVLVYLIIGQFGIFSSPTISPPNSQLGLVFFGLFFLGALLFVKQTYKNFKIGLLHLTVSLIFGVLLSFILGYFWSAIPVSTLFSLKYFGTNCVVAVITGMAVSLIMTGK